MSQHNPPNTSDIHRTKRQGHDPRRESRLFGQIVTLASPAQILGPTGSYTSGPIIPPVMSTIFPRRPSATSFADRVTVPGLVTSPRTPENPRRYATTPVPPRIVEIDEEDEEPIPAPAFAHAEEEVSDTSAPHQAQASSRPRSAPPSGEDPDPYWPPRPFPGGGPPGGGPSDPSGGGPSGPSGPSGPPHGHPSGPPGGGPSGPPGGGPPGGGPPGGGPPGPGQPPLINPDGQVNNAAADRVLLDTALTFRDFLLAFGQQVNAPPRTARSNLSAPDKFDGTDPSKLAPFLTACYLHFSERPQDFPTDDDKIFYIISYLRGSAQQWFSPNLYNTSVIPAWDGNFALFIQELSLNFGPHDPVGDAEDRLRSCRMKTGDRIATYIIAFDQLALLTDFGDSALRHQFYEGLPRRIKDDMVHHSYVNSLIGVKNVARLIDARYWKRESEKERERERDRSSGSGTGSGGSGSNPSAGRSGNSSGSGQQQQQRGKKGKSSSGNNNSSGNNSSGNTSSANQSSGQSSSANTSSQTEKKKKPYADKLDSRGKIKQDERDRRKKNNLCMYCGGGGHTAENCKKRPAEQQQQSSGKAAATTPSATPQAAPANPEK
jgi:hypothetical protein